MLYFIKPMEISLRWLIILERVLLGVLGGACLYIFYFLTTNHHRIPPDPAPQAAASTAEAVGAPVLPALPSYENYAAKINRRDLFSFSTVSTDLNTSTAAAGSLPVDLKVVGIVLGNPAEVIIENTNAHQTLFIQQGKETDGISIQKVQAHQIILNYRGQLVVVALKENK